MELRNYGVAKIIRRCDRLGRNAQKGIGDVEDRPHTVDYPLGVAWSGGRNRRSALASDLSTIAASIRFIAGIGAIAILYFGRACHSQWRSYSRLFSRHPFACCVGGAWVDCHLS